MTKEWRYVQALSNLAYTAAFLLNGRLWVVLFLSRTLFEQY
jgi:hypothetical protein